MKAWSYLSSGFTNIPIPSNIQKRLYKFLLRKAIGQFLATDLDVDNFDIELLNGSVELRDLELNLDAINDLLIDTPFMVVKGRAGVISASLPWFNWSGETTLKVQGLNLTLKPTSEKRTRHASENSDETSPVMSSSLHFADDFLKTEMEPDQDQELYESIQQLQDPEQTELDAGIGGLQVLTRVIDKMMAKVKVDIIDTVIHVIHPSAVTLAGDLHRPGGGNKEYSLDIEIPKLSYFDETPGFSDDNNSTPIAVPEANMLESSILYPSSGDEIIKIITITSPKIWIRSCDIPSIYFQSTKSETTLNINDDTIDDTTADLSQTEFYDASQGDSNLFQRGSLHSSFMSGSITPKAFPPSSHNDSYEALLFTTMDKENWIRLKERPSCSFDNRQTAPKSSSQPSPPTKSIDIYFSHIRTVITPKQVAFLLDIFAATNSPSLNEFTQSTPTPDPAATSSRKRRASNLGEVIREQRRPSYTSISPPMTNTNGPASHREQDSRTNLGSYSSFKMSTEHPPSSSSPPPDIKVKLQVPTTELFFLYNELPPTSSSSTIWSSTTEPPTRDTSHLKLWIHQLIIRLQQYPISNAKATSSDSRRSDGLRRSPLPRIDTTSKSTTSRQIPALSSLLDMRIRSMGLAEWVTPLLDHASTTIPATTFSVPKTHSSTTTSSSSIKMKYNCYLPILEFDDSICMDYDDTQDFPVYMDQLSTGNRGEKTGHMGDGHGKTKKDVIRVRLEKRSSVKLDQFNEMTFYDQDLTTDIQAMKLLLDPNIADRLENYAYALINHSRINPKQNINENVSISEPSFDQKIYEDLDKGTKEHQQRIQAKIRLAFLRLILYTPDMSQSSTRDEFNDKFHNDVLSVDVKKITTCWNTDLLKNQPQRIAVDLDAINVFLKKSQDPLTRCWFTAKGQRNGDSLSPSMEIVLRSLASDTSHAPSSARPGYFGTGSDIPSNLFEYLSRNEFCHSEEKIHVPVEDQAESAMVFKQRTVETSTIVINCHFPTTHMTLSKQTWDKVQILQNDLLLWQPRIIAQLEREQDRTDTSTTGSLHSESFKASPYRRYSDLESSRTSILSQSHERLGQLHNAQTSSLFSVIAVMSEGVWDLHTDSTNEKTHSTYRLQFSDFRYFAVIKHLGMNENITTLDIEDLTLDDIGNGIRPIPLFYRTLPKSILPKRNTSMVSIFSRLTTIPELNKQSKSTSVVACNLCWKFTPEVSFIENLIGFQKAPDDLVFIDPPTQHIKVYAHVLDTSVDYKPISIPSRVVIVVDNIQVVTDILAGQPLIDIKTFIEKVDVFLVDDVSELDERRVQETSKTLDARNYWSMYGMANVLTSRNLETQVKVKLDEMLAAPGIEVAILNDILTLEGCADSFQSFNSFITYAANDGDRTKRPAGEKPTTTAKKSAKKTHTTLIKTKEDMLSSLDEDAFKHRQQQQQQHQNQPSSSTGTPAASHYSPVPTDLKMVEGYYSGPSTSTSTSKASSYTIRPRKPRRKHYQQQKAPEDIIRVLLDEMQELDIVENYYSIDKKKVARKPVVDIRRSIVSIRVKDVDIIWKLYDGYDWSYVHSSLESPTHSTSAPSPSPATKRRSSSRPSSSSSNHRYSTGYSNSITGNSDFRTLSNQSPSLTDRPPSLPGQSPNYAADGGPSGNSFGDYRHSQSSSMDSRRSSFSKHSSSTHSRPHRHGRRTGPADMELRIEGIGFELDIMAPEEQTCLHTHLEIRDIEVIDNIKTSTWDTFFGSMRSDSPSTPPRETDSCMLVVDLIGTRPVIQDTTVEYRLRIKTLPMRLYIDQDALNFLVKFFTFNPTILRSFAGAKSSSFSDTSPAHDINTQHQYHHQQHHPLSSSHGGRTTNNVTSEGVSQQSQDSKDYDIFFQSVEIHPIDLKIDYKPKYINYDNIKEGQYAELVNLFQLEGAKLNLSAVKLNGINGVPKLLDRLIQEWLPHIKNTQVPHMVSGVSPIRSMLNLGSGVADLILLPIQQYRKDGRVIKGLQKGTQSFARSTAMEVVKLSARLASGTQVILEHADGYLSSGALVSAATQQHQQQQQQRRQQHNHRHAPHSTSMDSRNDTISSSSSISTVIGSRTSEDMVFIFTDKNLGRDED